MIGADSIRVRVRRSNAARGGDVTVSHVLEGSQFDVWRTSEITSIAVGVPRPTVSASPSDVAAIEAVIAVLGQLPPPRSPDDTFLLDVRSRYLAGLPWEEMAQRLGRRIIRYSRGTARHAYEPVDMPLSVLFANTAGESDKRFELSSRYFRTAQASGQSVENISRLISSARFDIVHIGCQVVPGGPGDGAGIVVHTDGGVVEPHALATSIERAATRLLIIENQLGVQRSGLVDLGPLRELAHRIHRATGVAAIVTPTADFSSFYYDLTHDSHLTDLVTRILVESSDQSAPALWLRNGGDSVLRLMGASARLAADVIHEHERVDAALRAQREFGREEDELGDWRAVGPDLVDRATIDALARLDSLRERTFAFDRETNGILPMTDTSNELNEVRQGRERDVAEPGRVLNAWLQSGSRPVPPTTSLAADTPYSLNVSIGLADRRSATVAPITIDDEALSPAFDRDAYADLTIVVSSADVTVDEPRKVLRLPAPPDDAVPVQFEIKTPIGAGQYRLRVGIYHQNNLLQSLIMTMNVTDGVYANRGVGYQVELEWALSSTLRGLDELRQPALSIVSNEDPTGTHTFVIVSDGGTTPDIHKQIDIPPDQLKATIDDVRDELQQVCSTFRNGKLDRYRFGRDNRGDKKQFLEDLQRLALAGSGLFAELTTGADPTFNHLLETQLQGCKLIQIASVKSANYVFPWSVVYDHEFRDGPSTRLCRVTEAVFDRAGSAPDLLATPCFADECPDRNDPRVVCPSGFWGFRHVIEQPLLTSAVIDPEDERDAVVAGGSPRHDVVTEIPLNGRAAPEVIIGLSESLSDWSKHAQEATAALGGFATQSSSVDPLLDSLRRLDLNLAYFYCHGGRQKSKAFLGLGNRLGEDRLFPQYLKSVSWPSQHPFVFINGCRTVGVSPDDLLSFNRVFARAQASGVLGTEISVPEGLATAVALQFFDGFRREEPVGRIVRDIRLELLSRLNPLGLAYTPYCMASLRLST